MCQLRSILLPFFARFARQWGPEQTTTTLFYPSSTDLAHSPSSFSRPCMCQARLWKGHGPSFPRVRVNFTVSVGPSLHPLPFIWFMHGGGGQGNNVHFVSVPFLPIPFVPAQEYFVPFSVRHQFSSLCLRYFLSSLWHTVEMGTPPCKERRHHFLSR